MSHEARKAADELWTKPCSHPGGPSLASSCLLCIEDVLDRYAKAEADKGTLMDQYERARHAEYKLEQAVVDAFGGLDAIWFQNWYFDTYDSSVELTEAEVGREPTPEQLAALLVAGVWIAFVSYLDGTARHWSWRKDTGWTSGTCSPRTHDIDKRGLLREAAREVQRLREEADQLRAAVWSALSGKQEADRRVQEERRRIAGELRDRSLISGIQAGMELREVARELERARGLAPEPEKA